MQWESPLRWYIIASIVVIHMLILFFAVKNVQLRFFIPYVNSTRGQGALLTFDDGPIDSDTLRVAETLSKHGVKGVFFLIGEQISEHQNIVKGLISMGHMIGNHSYSHAKNFPMMTTQSVVEDIEKCAGQIEPLTPQSIVPFRVPYGLTNPRIGRAVKRMNLLTIGWNLRSFDTMKSGDEVSKKLKKNIKNNSIVLLHDHSDFSKNNLDEFLQWAARNEIKFADPHAFIDSIQS
ncbi:MAG: peptidoglycan/xylan/chitin deacetylase (PgdA/CDA1 family) [Flavobacteriales bacterium]|jgi:peptidoglycan/xylan/chitin deacetylase (PgdA/CDA1 family)